jgi:hypothetical protein
MDTLNLIVVISLAFSHEGFEAASNSSYEILKLAYMGFPG